MGLWETFCGDTSLHGYQYIGRYLRSSQNINSIQQFIHRKERRPVWVVVVLMSILGAIGFLMYNIDEYMESFTVTTLQSSTSQLKNIFYPSVTVCHMNQIRNDNESVQISMIKLYILESLSGQAQELLKRQIVEKENLCTIFLLEQRQLLQNKRIKKWLPCLDHLPSKKNTVTI